jgi:hypothetical protein
MEKAGSKSSRMKPKWLALRSAGHIAQKVASIDQYTSPLQRNVLLFSQAVRDQATTNKLPTKFKFPALTTKNLSDLKRRWSHNTHC